VTFTSDFLNLKIGTPGPENVYTNFLFSMLFTYELRAQTEPTDRPTDGRTS